MYLGYINDYYYDVNLVFTIVKGFPQIFFQENLILGLLLIAALAIFSPIGLLLAVVGNVTGILVGTLLGAKKSVIDAGLFGFNGVLIGTMVSFYIKQFPMALVVTVLACAAAAVIYYLFLKNNIPAFAAPFVLAAWIILIILRFIKLN